MVYNNDISTTVSLSTVLDYFISSNENSQVIVDFLILHDDIFKELVNESLLYTRIFQLDFFLTCSSSHQEYLIHKLADIPLTVATILAWQILKSNSCKAHDVKYRMRNELKKFLSTFNSTTVSSKRSSYEMVLIKHPYNRNEKYVADIDSLCFKAASHNEIKDLFVQLSYENPNRLISWIKYVFNSLFKYRFLQYDVFSELNPSCQYVCMKTVQNMICDNIAPELHSITFVKQLLCSDINAAEKYEYYKMLVKNKTAILPFFVNINEAMFISRCKSFQEFMMKAVITNTCLSSNIVMFFLIDEIDWLFEWLKYDKENLDSYLKISDLVEFIQNSKNA